MNHILIKDTCQNMRKGAREELSGKWADAVKATLIYFAVMGIPVLLASLMFDEDYASIVTSLYSIAVGGPITLGYTSYIIKTVRHMPAQPSDVLSGFERYASAIVLYVLTGIFIFLWSLLLVIPGIIAMYRYRMAFFVLFDNPHIGALEAINESKRLMTGNKGKLFLLDLSFIGWAILASMTFGIGYLALFPYFMAASAVFYELVNGNLKEKEPDITYGMYYQEHSENDSRE